MFDILHYNSNMYYLTENEILHIIGKLLKLYI